MERLSRWGVIFGITLAVQTLVLLALAALLQQFAVGSVGGAVALAAIASILLTLAYPYTLRLSFRFRPLLFFIFSWLLTLAVFRIAVEVVDWTGFPSVTISGFWTTVLVVVCLVCAQSLAGALQVSTDDFGYWAGVRSALAHRFRDRDGADSDTGVIFLEIDGLAKPILEEALAAGYLPNLKEWLERDGYIVSGWEPDLSSQTSASQAGILLGSNENIPAFRWWSKRDGKPEVSSSPSTASALESRLSTGAGLLAGGASRWNAFSGDADDAVATFSTVLGRDMRGTVAAIVYLSNPIAVARTTGLFVAEVIRERWQAWRQRRHDIQPRMHRSFKYALVRAATNTSMQEMCFVMVMSDMLEGVPAVYATFFAYDEVAHHSGPRTTDAFKVLRTLDAGFARLAEVKSRAPRPYELVVLSDHGQSAGATFQDRFGLSLRELMLQLVEEGRSVRSFAGQSEAEGALSATVNLWLTQDTALTRAAQRVSPGPVSVGQLESAGDVGEEADNAELEQLQDGDIVVMASGNLGLVSFAGIDGRVPLEEIESSIPGLLDGLASHPGISFVMVHAREGDEAVAIGSRGRHYLRANRVVGEDPLAIFNGTSRQHLIRWDGFDDAPDILVMSMYDPDTQETAAFEELIGNHGGLGGPQQDPFVLYPARLRFPDEPVVGAAGLHQVLKGWVRDLQPDRFGAVSDGP